MSSSAPFGWLRGSVVLFAYKGGRCVRTGVLEQPVAPVTVQLHSRADDIRLSDQELGQWASASMLW